MATRNSTRLAAKQQLLTQALTATHVRAAETGIPAELLDVATRFTHRSKANTVITTPTSISGADKSGLTDGGSEAPTMNKSPTASLMSPSRMEEMQTKTAIDVYTWPENKDDRRDPEAWQKQLVTVQLPVHAPIILPVLDLTLIRDAFEFTTPEHFSDIAILDWVKKNSVLPCIKQCSDEFAQEVNAHISMQAELAGQSHAWTDARNKIANLAMPKKCPPDTPMHLAIMAKHARRIVNGNRTWFQNYFNPISMQDIDPYLATASILLTVWRDVEEHGTYSFFGILLNSRLAEPHQTHSRKILEKWYLIDKTVYAKHASDKVQAAVHEQHCQTDLQHSSPSTQTPDTSPISVGSAYAAEFEPRMREDMAAASSELFNIASRVQLMTLNNLDLSSDPELSRLWQQQAGALLQLWRQILG